LFGNSCTFLNYFGYVVAFLAVGMYNVNKLKAAKAKERAERVGAKGGGGTAGGGGGGGGIAGAAAASSSSGGNSPRHDERV
jgi:hypothetical protein